VQRVLLALLVGLALAGSLRDGLFTNVVEPDEAGPEAAVIRLPRFDCIVELVGS